MLQKIAKKDSKAKFLEAYERSFGNISQACELVGISRQTFYRWKNSYQPEDAEFKAALSALKPDEIFLDFVESALVQRIRAGDTTAIIFTLKTKGRKRGYVENDAKLQQIEADHTAATQRLKDALDRAAKVLAAESQGELTVEQARERLRARLAIVSD